MIFIYYTSVCQFYYAQMHLSVTLSHNLLVNFNSDTSVYQFYFVKFHLANLFSTEESVNTLFSVRVSLVFCQDLAENFTLSISDYQI